MTATQCNDDAALETYVMLMSRGSYLAAASIAHAHRLGALLIDDAANQAMLRYTDPKFVQFQSQVDDVLADIDQTLANAYVKECVSRQFAEG